VVAQQAAKVLKKTVMELGSNDAFIVLEDADLELAATTCAHARLYNNGETCVAAKRFIVVDSVYDEFRELLIEKFKGYKVGDPMQETTDVGPMSSTQQRETLQKQVQESIDKGAKVAYSSDVDDSLPKEGAYQPLVILENISEDQPAYKDELFGPVASLIRAKDEKDAFRIANDSRYGLGGGVFSKDEDKAIRLATKYFDTGMIYINGYSLVQPGLPFGGVKDSGFGREHGGFGIKEFVNIKALHVVGKAPA
jgi:succinate-semialdehyde dehydrogenase/glutarate-semialdehyde dehydrogenase